ncbi:Rab3 GTPase-activating protein non-catalytic subunit [Podila verticillata]|nr:Rab3 GTPase-activating protein non-catalytic subunit [Podila verticillata]
MSHHRWELSPLGSIPNEVLSILLGSLPKVPDPRQEVEALERQLSTHDDRLSEDEDDDSRQGDSLIHEPISTSDDANTYLEQLDSDRNDGKSSPGEDSQRSWNVPDDEWEWSDEDGSSNNTPSSSTSRVSNRPVTTSGSKRDSSLKVPSRTSQKPTGLGLLNPSAQGPSKGNMQTFAPGIPLSSGASSSNRHPHHHHSSRTSAESTHSHPLSVAQDLSISICDSGRYLACASKKMFAILQYCPDQRSPTAQSPKDGGGSPQTSNDWVLVGQGSGVDNSLSHQSQIYVVVGYKSGMIRIFNETGQLVVIQQLHHTPVISIKARIGTGKVPGEDEDEMTILHEGGKVVCIEGESLWVVLRLSNGSSRLSIDNKGSAAPTFAYKKWSLLNQDLLVDVVSCGPARHKPTLSNGFSSSSSSSMYTSQATERFVTVGSKPMIAFYASSSSSRPLFSATSLATQMAAKVTSAVFGFAKSIWGSTSPRPGSPALGSSPSGRTSPDQKRLSGQGGVQEGIYGSIYSSAMAPATEVPAVLWLSDSQRCIRHVSLAPLPPRGSCHHHPSKLAAMTDSLGRVLLVDLEECEIIRMWKGLRGARCGWIQEERLIKTGRGRGSDTDTTAKVKRRLLLYLVIYAPKRGTAEIYPARQGKRVGLLQVGLGWKVCTTFTSPIGKPIVLDRIAGAPRPGETFSLSPLISNPGSPMVGSSGSTPLGLAQCLLIGPRGEVRRVGSVPADSSVQSSPGSQLNVGSDATNSLIVSPALPSSTTEDIQNLQ